MELKSNKKKSEISREESTEVNPEDSSKDIPQQKFTLKDIILTTIFTIAFLIQIALIFLFSNEMGLAILLYLGYVPWIFSIYLGFIPHHIFKKLGGVKKGKSYIHTSILVDKGPYAIIRHPHYLAGVLFTISITMWTQTLLSLILTILIIVLTYQWTFSEEKSLVEKFGDNYHTYQKKVARINPIYGLYKYFTKKITEANSLCPRLCI